MKRIHSITLKNFKAFQDAAPVVLEGKNLLLYGANGSGKSSLYWALYTFLQSSRKKPDEVSKYFDRVHHENLVNVYAPADAAASISLTLRDAATSGSDEVLQIAMDKRETDREDVKKASLASDFITYRVLFRFYHFSNRDEIDLWPVFVREILPLCPSSLGELDLGDAWDKLIRLNPYETNRSLGYRGRNGTQTYREWNAKCDMFNKALDELIASINVAAQTFYNANFHRDGEPALTLKLGVTRKADFDRKDHKVVLPRIGMLVKLGPVEVRRPQSFLNEAKLTQLAVSIRLGATKVHLRDCPLRLLVLDDLLISLDMSNRVQVIQIILNDPDFAECQKIIMTHDRGFYREIRRSIGVCHGDWVFACIRRAGHASPVVEEDPDDIQKAEAFIKAGLLEEASLQLRKTAEDTLRRFVVNYPDTGEFKSLTDLWRQARGELERNALMALAKFLGDEEVDDATLALLIPDKMDDIIGNAALTQEQKTRCCGRRTGLRRVLKMLDAGQRRALSVIAEIDRVKDRILNPAAHAGDPPLYDKEVEEALKLVRELKQVLSSPAVPSPTIAPGASVPVPMAPASSSGGSSS